MNVCDHASHPREEWRAGVVTRMQVSALNGSTQLCLFEQWCDPGLGAPNHRHPVEEVLTVLAGEAEVWVGEERAVLTAGQSMIVPPHTAHGFRNRGTATLHVLATLAAPTFEAAYDDRREVSRRWQPPATSG